MYRRRNATSNAVTGIIVLVVLVVAGAGGYYVGLSSSSATTVTHTLTNTVTATVSTSETGMNTTTGNPADNATHGVPTYIINQGKAEGGALTVYGLADANAWTAPGGPDDTFMKLYPWAKVSYLALNSGDMENKMLAEFKANAVQSDITQNNNAPSLNDYNAGMYVPFCNPLEATAGYPASVLAGLVPNDPNSKCVFHPAFGNYAAFAWNTNQVSAAQAANFTKWSDIVNSQWKGVIAVDKPTRLSTFGGLLEWMGENMTGTQWVAFMNQFKANNPILTADLGSVFTDVSSGQASVGISTTDDLVSGVKPGVPVAYKWVSPIPVLSNFFKISKGAPHPAMAELWIYFITSYAGQYSIGAGAGRLPMLPSAAQATVLKTVTPIPSGFTYFINPDTKVLNNQTALRSLYTSIYGS